MFPPCPASTEGGKKVSQRCTPKRRMAHRLGTAGYSSTLRSRSAYRDCSKNRKVSLRWKKKHLPRLILMLLVFLMVGTMAVLLLLRATTLPGVSSTVNATGEEVSLSSRTGISQLPKTGGP